MKNKEGNWRRSRPKLFSGSMLAPSRKSNLTLNVFTSRGFEPATLVPGQLPNILEIGLIFTINRICIDVVYWQSIRVSFCFFFMLFSSYASSLLNADLWKPFLKDFLLQNMNHENESVLYMSLALLLQKWHLEGTPYDLSLKQILFRARSGTRSAWCILPVIIE